MIGGSSHIKHNVAGLVLHMTIFTENPCLRQKVLVWSIIAQAIIKVIDALKGVFGHIRKNVGIPFLPRWGQKTR